MKEIVLGLLFIGLILPIAVIMWKMLIDVLRNK